VIKSNIPYYPHVFRNVNFGISSNINLANIFALDTSIAFTAGIIGNTTYVYRTTNGGNNWSVVFTQLNGFVNAVWMRDASRGILVGNPVSGRWSIWKTSTGGATWDSSGMHLPQAGNETGWQNSLYCFDSSYSFPVWRLWFGTNNSRIYYSTNWGSSWIVQSTSPQTNSMTILFNRQESGGGLAGGPYLMKTIDFGYNWIQMPGILGSGNISGLAGNNHGIDALYFPYIWYVRNDNKLYYTSNSGFNWLVQYSAPSGSYKYVSQGRPGGYGQIFAVRDNGGISYCYCPPSGVKKISQLTPGIFALHQNYPNPFNPITTIRFDVPSVTLIHKLPLRLVVYNVLGQEAVILVNEPLKPGTYEVEWDASSHPSGVYFYELQAGDYKLTKKMVLVK
jgi:hypothetical protein